MQFVPLTEAHLPAVEPWFDDAETQLYLGGRGWVRREIELMRSSVGEEFRGRRILDRYVWVVFEEETPVALLDVEPYDDETAGFCFVVAPEARGRGVATRVLLTMDELPELGDVRCFIGAVQTENIASRRCLKKAGFRVDERPDDEGMSRCERWR